MLAHGFSRQVILLHARFVTATPERTFVAQRPVHITRVRITEIGRRAVAERQG